MFNLQPPRVIDRNIHGTIEQNGLVNGQEYHSIDRPVSVEWDDPNLGQITRLRLLSDPGYPLWDVSYCHGVLKDGTPCSVVLPFSELPKRGFKRAIVQYAIKDGIHAARLGTLDAISTLI